MSVRPIRRQNPDGGRQEGNNKETSQLPLSQKTRGCDEILCLRSTQTARLYFQPLRSPQVTYFYEEKCEKDVFVINDCSRKSHEETLVLETFNFNQLIFWRNNAKILIKKINIKTWFWNMIDKFFDNMIS